MPGQDTQAKPARRRYTTEFKRELVERCLQPGASVSGIALDNGINANVLFRWRREQLLGTPGVHDHCTAQPVLLPVKLAASLTPAGPESLSSRAPKLAGIIEIDIGAARVRLHGCVDEANLRCVLHTLRATA
jgi:transposase